MSLKIPRLFAQCAMLYIYWSQPELTLAENIETLFGASSYWGWELCFAFSGMSVVLIALRVKNRGKCSGISRCAHRAKMAGVCFLPWTVRKRNFLGYGS